jgi:hypothetical protein
MMRKKTIFEMGRPLQAAVALMAWDEQNLHK